ncbi:basic salivary proline-rich protein 1-like [Ahaetulla prasina]|uniref:basic salivary proline-rich protein 1-like n=1 Tax=Ahaetulla prasina TaxID=499056 RepID=UPI002649519D|nr:basic salivary proline-rich protein 1-like [Ahaetulla prasina]
MEIPPLGPPPGDGARPSFQARQIQPGTPLESPNLVEGARLDPSPPLWLETLHCPPLGAGERPPFQARQIQPETPLARWRSPARTPHPGDGARPLSKPGRFQPATPLESLNLEEGRLTLPPSGWRPPLPPRRWRAPPSKPGRFSRRPLASLNLGRGAWALPPSGWRPPLPPLGAGERPSFQARQIQLESPNLEEGRAWTLPPSGWRPPLPPLGAGERPLQARQISAGDPAGVPKFGGGARLGPPSPGWRPPLPPLGAGERPSPFQARQIQLESPNLEEGARLDLSLAPGWRPSPGFGKAGASPPPHFFSGPGQSSCGRRVQNKASILPPAIQTLLNEPPEATSAGGRG